MSSPFSRTTRALAQQRATPALLAWGLAGLGLAAWVAWFVLGRVTVYEVSGKARLEVTQAAHAVTAQVPGRVTANALALGSVVREGDVIAELDAGDARLRLREEGARRAALAAQAAALRQEIASREQAVQQDRVAASAAEQGARLRTQEADAAASFATANERRLRADSEAGGVARVEALAAQTEAQKLAAARGALAAEADRLQADGRVRGAQQRAAIDALRRQLAALEGELATAAATVERLTLDIEQRLLRAPIAGRIGDVAPLRPGTWVTAGQRFATVVPDGEFVVVADFEPAAALGRVRPGQRAQMRLDGFPWAQYGTLGATVTRVGGEIRDNLVRVEFRPQAPVPKDIVLQHGLPGAIEVTLEQVAPAVLLLRSAGLAGDGRVARP